MVLIFLNMTELDLDRDILIDIELAENRSNTILAVEDGAAMASFTPSPSKMKILFTI